MEAESENREAFNNLLEVRAEALFFKYWALELSFLVPAVNQSQEPLHQRGLWTGPSSCRSQHED